MSEIQATQQKKFVDPSDPLWSFVEGIAHDESLLIYDISRPRNGLLRIFLDNKQSESSEQASSITVDDCTNVCRRLMHAFTVEGSALGVGESPELEVSSPGLDRFLRLASHFKSAIGSPVKLWIDDKVITGEIDSVSDVSFVLKKESQEEREEFKFTQIKKAQLVF